MMQWFVVYMLMNVGPGITTPFQMMPAASHERCIETGEAWVQQMSNQIGHARYVCIQLPDARFER